MAEGFTNFETALISEILVNLHNNYSDNYDKYRFGPAETEKRSLKGLLRIPVNHLLVKRDFHKIMDKTHAATIKKLSGVDQLFPGLKLLYDSLSDAESKSLLLKLIAFRILDHSKVKLPVSTPEYWAGVKKIEALADHQNCIDVKGLAWRLYYIDLISLQIPVRLFFIPIGVYIDFILKQYEYKTASKLITIKPGDYIIDAGGCFGDTALYFAFQTGAEGKVFTFEFIPSNLAILHRNLALNTELMGRVTVVEKPVWDISGQLMYFTDNGPGSSVSLNESKEADGNVKSISIDDFAETQNAQCINVIKMDIEGAELNALKGSVKTLKKHRPVLMIAIYHSLDDFVAIPSFIASLNLGYRFYLGHYTIHAEETILFADPTNQ